MKSYDGLMHDRLPDLFERKKARIANAVYVGENLMRFTDAQKSMARRINLIGIGSKFPRCRIDDSCDVTTDKALRFLQRLKTLDYVKSDGHGIWVLEKEIPL